MITTPYQVGHPVICRGKFAQGFSLRGVVEDLRETDGQVFIGVRLENNNFQWFPESDVRNAR